MIRKRGKIKTADRTTCSKCESPDGNFRNGWCRKCHNAAIYNHRKKHPEKYAYYGLKTSLKVKYGITIEQKHILLFEQRFQCAACKARLYPDRHTHIDHCHNNGAIRGILCRDCNLSLGHMKEDSKRLRMLADYIDKFKKKEE